MAVQRYAPTVIKVIDVLLFFFLEKKSYLNTVYGLSSSSFID
jgi:hypothetical protein